MHVAALREEIAVAPATSDAEVRFVSHWIDGAARTSNSGRTAPVHNPATGAVTARVALADQAEIDEAIASAEAGFAVWKDYSIAKRQTVLFNFREILNARKRELAEIVTAVPLSLSARAWASDSFSAAAFSSSALRASKFARFSLVAGIAFAYGNRKLRA